jgi:hypothetical protein
VLGSRGALATLAVALGCVLQAFAATPLPAASARDGERAARLPAASARDGERAALDRARALWEAQDVRSYRFRVRISCDCGRAADHPLEITVLDGRPRDAEYFPGQLQDFPEMFRLIGRVLDDPQGGAVSVRYDPRRGFPRSARLDSINWAIDRFQPL